MQRESVSHFFLWKTRLYIYIYIYMQGSLYLTFPYGKHGSTIFSAGICIDAFITSPYENHLLTKIMAGAVGEHRTHAPPAESAPLDAKSGEAFEAHILGAVLLLPRQPSRLV